MLVLLQGPRSYFESGGADKQLKVVGLKHFFLSNSIIFKTVAGL